MTEFQNSSIERPDDLYATPADSLEVHRGLLPDTAEFMVSISTGGEVLDLFNFEGESLGRCGISSLQLTDLILPTH